jgi:D-apiose dehydrogenase
MPHWRRTVYDPRELSLANAHISYSSRVERQCFPETLIYIEGKQGTVELGSDLWIRVTTTAGTFSRRHAPPHFAWADLRYAVVHASIVPCNANLLQSLQTGTPAETSGEENLKTMRLVYAAYELADRNRVIDLT